MSARLGGGFFTVCLETMEELDNERNAVFGHVVEGLDVVREISLLSVSEHGTPPVDVWVEECGESQSTLFKSSAPLVF